MRRAGAGVFASLVVLMGCALGVGVATAAKPPTNTSSVTIGVASNPVVFGHTTFISGVVSGKKAAGATVTLEENTAPFTGGFTAVRSTKANALGHYTFRAGPTLNTRYRVVAKAAPLARSAVKLVNVKVGVTLSVSTRFPKAGSRVRFSGFVLPAYNGKFAQIQRHTPTGWKTVAQVQLLAASNGSTAIGSVPRSHYGKRLKINKNGTYRVRFDPKDGLRLPNTSPSRGLTVH